MGEKLNARHLAYLRFILREGPGTVPDTKAGRTPKPVSQLVEGGFLETLNRIRPGATMYEITEAGRAALLHAEGEQK